MIDRIYELYSDLERHRVMLSFQGALSEDLISALLGLVEKKLTRIEPDARARKRVFNVVMECLQNLYHHTAGMTSGDPIPAASDARGVVMIAQNDRGWNVLTGNFMAATDVEKLRAHLEQLNAMDAGRLRDLYKETLNDGRYGAHGGGGLGIIDIARKSGRKLEFGFVPSDEESTFFSLQVNLPAGEAGTPEKPE